MFVPGFKLMSLDPKVYYRLSNQKYIQNNSLICLVVLYLAMFLSLVYESQEQKEHEILNNKGWQNVGILDYYFFRGGHEKSIFLKKKKKANWEIWALAWQRRLGDSLQVNSTKLSGLFAICELY